MARSIHLGLQGHAEKFVNEMIDQGWTEQDVFSRAMWLFQLAVTTKGVALLTESQEMAYTFGLEAHAGDTASALEARSPKGCTRRSV